MLITFCPNVSGQERSTYHCNLNQELGFFGGGAISLALGLKLKSNIHPYGPSNKAPHNKLEINRFDRIAIDHYSPNAKQTSDLIGYSSFALPLLLALDKNSNNDLKNIGLVWGEVILINAGLTSISKHIFKRPRPFVYNTRESQYDSESLNAQASFVSGHTSLMASNMYFFAKTFAIYFPDSKWKPAVYGLAITAPAVMGYLRVRAGVHYPTDVIAGYGLGAVVGLLVPALHLKSKKLTTISSQDQIGILFTF